MPFHVCDIITNRNTQRTFTNNPSRKTKKQTSATPPLPASSVAGATSNGAAADVTPLPLTSSDAIAPLDRAGIDATVKVGGVGPELSVDEKAVVLACAISIDFDYFSRHSGGAGIPYMHACICIPYIHTYLCMNIYMYIYVYLYK